MTETIEPIGGFLFAVFIVAALAAILGWETGKKLPDRWLYAPVGGVLSVIGTVLIGSLYGLVVGTIPFAGISKIVSVLIDDPLGMIAYHLETGIEYSVLGLASSLFCFLIAFVKSRRATY